MALSALVWLPEPRAQGAPAESKAAPPAADASLEDRRQTPLVPGPVNIQGHLLQELPAAGRGRLSMVFSGNRRWCTWPDDRVIRLPERQGLNSKPERFPVYTFGYQFTIAAVARAAPQVTLLLFESPVIRTASLRQAAKLGRPPKTPQPAPPIASEIDRRKSVQPLETPSALIPVWLEQFGCATLAERFDFDLDPGVYDIYIAFDLMNRDGGWVHRSSDYLTDVTVAAGQRSLLEGAVNFEGGGRREVSLQRSMLQALSSPAGAGGP